MHAQKTLELLDIRRFVMHAQTRLPVCAGMLEKAAQGYMDSFERARAARTRNPRIEFFSQGVEKSLKQVTGSETRSLETIDDDTGIFSTQFSRPNR